METIWINGRFLSKKITGVQRVAYEILNYLSENCLSHDGIVNIDNIEYQVKLITSTNLNISSPWKNIPLVKKGILSGHLWEQLELPIATNGNCLLSLCNTGPMFKRNHVLFLHDAQTFAIPENFSLIFRYWYRILFKVSSRFAKEILVNSKFTKHELSKYLNVSSDKFKVCTFGSDHLIRKRIISVDKSKIKNLPSAPFLLAVSSNNPNKNFSSIAKALELLGEDAPPCIVVGQQNQKHFKSVNLNKSNIIHLGYVSDDTLTYLYQNALALIFPSFYEGFGFPPIEAMVNGCPVILSNTSSMPEIGGNSVLYCDPYDPESIADAVKMLTQMPGLHEKLQSSGKNRAKHFTWSAACKTVLSSINVEPHKANTITNMWYIA